jgi:hypothetical protein
MRLPPRLWCAQPYNILVARNRPEQHLAASRCSPGAKVQRIFVRLKVFIGHWPAAMILIGLLLTLVWIGVLVGTFLFFLAG